MNSIFKTTLLLLSPLAFFSCNKDATGADSAAPTAEEIASATSYPLDVCIVSGEKLGSMGEPTVINHEGQQIKFCCDNCQPKFENDPAKYLGKLDAPTE